MLRHVSPDYRHRPKRAEPRGALVAGSNVLKWYDLEEAGLPVAESVRALAQAAAHKIVAENALKDEAGFAILHKCGESFHFLMLCTWRGNNEIWQSVHYIDAGMQGFRSFPPAYAGQGMPRPTFCVWEAGIVAQEAKFWAQFLESARTSDDIERWRADVAAFDV